MQISFTHRAFKVCNEKKEMVKTLGADCASKLQLRMFELTTAPNMARIPIHARLHGLKGNRIGQYAVDIDKQFRIIFVPDCETLPLKPDGGLDLVQVSSILVIEVTDYH